MCRDERCCRKAMLPSLIAQHLVDHLVMLFILIIIKHQTVRDAIVDPYYRRWIVEQYGIKL